ncbi:MAG: DUF4384 domain-containing protein [Bryobacteraceae bacterium]
MTQEEIRKLLGGYATDALSADERRMLFEAALEDQELFNALQNEDALRELLADPVSRAQVRQALEPSKSTRAGFAWRRWLWGVAMPAVVAVIVIALMNRARTPEPVEQLARSAPVDSRPVTPGPDALALDAVKQSTDVRTQGIAPKVAPKRPGGAPIRLDSAQDAKKQTAPDVARSTLVAPAAKALLAAPSPALPDAVRQQFSAGLAADARLYLGPLVRYSLVRGAAAGDGVRVEVTTGVAGYLALYEIDASGNSKRIYPADESPASEGATPVLPNQTIQIPNQPVVVDSGARLRLVVAPAGTTLGTGSIGGVTGGTLNGAAPTALVAPLQTAPTPLVVDIPVGP